jgi:hypothetical protein
LADDADANEYHPEMADDSDGEDEALDELNSKLQVQELLGCLNRKEGVDRLTIKTEDEYFEPLSIPLQTPDGTVMLTCATKPDDWVAPAPKTDLGEPKFEEVDNPGKWPQFCFTPKFKMEGRKAVQYLHHALPSGCTPVPLDQTTGKREVEGYEFHYEPYQHDEEYLKSLGYSGLFRPGATSENM